MRDPRNIGWSASADLGSRMCNCIGPQPGHKLCPCMESAKAQNDAITTQPYRDEIERLKRENERLRKAVRK